MTLRAKWPACQRSISSAAVARCATDPTNFPPPNGVSDSPADRCHQGGWDQSATVHLSNPQKRTANPFSPTLSDICPASLSARLSSIALDLLAPGLTEPLRISSFPSFSFFFYSSFPHLHINKSAARKGCAVGGFFFFASRTALQLVFCTFMRFCRIFFSCISVSKCVFFYFNGLLVCGNGYRNWQEMKTLQILWFATCPLFTWCQCNCFSSSYVTFCLRFLWETRVVVVGAVVGGHYQQQTPECLWVCPSWRHPTAQQSRLFFSLLALQEESFFKTEVTTGRIPDVMDHLLWMTACVLNGGKAEAIQQRHYQEVAALSRRAANAHTWTQEMHRGRSKMEEWSRTGNRGVTSLSSNPDRFLWVCSFLALILCVSWLITSSRNECARSHSVVKASGLSIQRDKWYTKEKENRQDSLFSTMDSAKEIPLFQGHKWCAFLEGSFRIVF